MEEDNNAHVLVSQSDSHMVCLLPPSQSFLHLFIRLTRTSVLVLQGKRQQTTNRNSTHRGITRKTNEKLKHCHHRHAATNEHLPKLPELTLCCDPIHAMSSCQPQK